MTKKYKKIGSKYFRKYGKSAKEFSRLVNVSQPTIVTWLEKGLNIFEKAKELNAMKGNKRLQRLWGNINQRCDCPTDKKYKYYGGKGIKVLLKKSDLNFLWHRDEAKNMKQPSIDRKDSNGHYCLENCRFVEMDFNRKMREY